MRVAFVTVGDTTRKTGGYLYHACIFEGLRKRGIEIEEIVPCGAAPAEQRAAAHRSGSFLYPNRFDAIVVDALARIVCAPHLDRWRASRPLVAMVHELPSVASGGDAGEISREREYEEPLLRADRLIAVSDHGKTILERRGVPAGRIRVVPPGFDRLDARPSGPGGGTVRALCVAQWIPRKGILTLVEAWARHDRPGAKLELIGETDADFAYADSVRAAISAAPGGSIIVSGRVDDTALGAAYAAADLFVLPSRYEGYGMVYAEALAFGLPVIACEAGPVPELVGRDAALLVPPDAAGALSEALDLLLNDPALRERMSSAARRRAARLPRWEEAVDGFRRALSDGVAHSVRRSGSSPV